MYPKLQQEDERALAALRRLKELGYETQTIRKTLPELTGITHSLAASLIGVSRQAVTLTMNAARANRNLQEKIASVYRLPVREMFDIESNVVDMSPEIIRKATGRVVSNG